MHRMWTTTYDTWERRQADNTWNELGDWLQDWCEEEPCEDHKRGFFQ